MEIRVLRCSRDSPRALPASRACLARDWSAPVHQMSRMLDVLEEFLTLHGHTYVRLDGTTGVEKRQRLMDRCPRDPKCVLGDVSPPRVRAMGGVASFGRAFVA